MDPMLAEAIKRIDDDGGWLASDHLHRTRQTAAARRATRRNARRLALRVAVP